jgi:hypothetical protein
MTGSSHLRPLVVAAKAAALEAVNEVLAGLPGEFSIAVHRRLHSILPRTDRWPKVAPRIAYSDGADFAVLRRLPGQTAKQYAAVVMDVVVDADAGAAVARKALLGHLGIAYLALRSGEQHRTFQSVLGGSEGWRDELTRALVGPIGDHHQLAFASTLEEGEVSAVLADRLAAVRLAYLEQIQLREVIDLSGERNQAIRKRISGWNRSRRTPISPDFSEMTDFDGVICTPPPFAIPLLLIEIDGPVHRDSGKPSKREKDKLKNGIAIDADIPLVRLDVGSDISVADQDNALRALVAVATHFSSDDFERLGTLLGMFSNNLESLPWDVADDIRSNFSYIQRTYERAIRHLSASLRNSETAEADDRAHLDCRDPVFDELDEQHELDCVYKLQMALNAGVEGISLLYAETSVEVSVTSEGSRITIHHEPAWWLPASAPLPKVKSQLEIPAFKMVLPDGYREIVRKAIAAEFRGDLVRQFRSQLSDYLNTNTQSLQQALLNDVQEREESWLRRGLRASAGHETRVSMAIYNWLGVPRSPVPFPSSESEAAARVAAIARLDHKLGRANAIVREVAGLDDESMSLVIEDVHERVLEKVASLEFRPFSTNEQRRHILLEMLRPKR